MSKETSQCPLSLPVYHCLSAANANLENHTELSNGASAAIWQREVTDLTRYQHPGHHTLSCYLDGGYDIRRLYQQRTISGGGPGRICLMPGDHESDWDVNGPIRFMHLYFSEEHLKALAGRIQDKGSDILQLQDLTFIDDPWISTLCQRLIMPLNWQDRADQLALSSASDMLMAHLLKHYCSDYHTLPDVPGGLSPYTQRQVLDYIEHHLDQALTLLQLAEVAHLSEYHFARMFKRSVGMAPHQYVTQRRLNLASRLLLNPELTLAEIALRCGFSSQSHFSNRFKAFYGVTPAGYRKAH
ncbi:AraC family transcriptional regulator [Oceanospirillum beijerinckii]|uniref:AraC family transcriptional regulator n=1 Tax=Oceanospirillum beijerinckii TaxID=64976 RepID=UPI0004286442|nr:AraC family transcriptional regulator [Oceanospirillum beijerinckii]